MRAHEPVQLKPILVVPEPQPQALTDRAAALAARAIHARGCLAPMYAANQALLMVEELAGMLAELAKRD